MEHEFQQEQGAVASFGPDDLSTRNTLSVDTKRQPSSTKFSNSEIEHTITQLLKSTKSILHALTAWSNGDMLADQVMDTYRSLEEYFGRACLAFQAVQLTLDEVAHVPDELHRCLEDALSNPPSVSALEQHLPAIRDTILQLLHSLKQKQALLRESRPAVSPTRRDPTNDAAAEFSPRPSSSESTCSSASPPLPPTQQQGSPTQLSEFDLNDPGTCEALATLKKHDNLARRSSVRRAYTAHRVDGYPIAPPRRHPVIREKTIAAHGSASDKLATQPPPNEREPGMVLFLEVRGKVKRVRLDAEGPVTIPDLRLLFLQNFEQIPDKPIHMRDPTTRIIYELEDVDDVIPNCLLILPENESEIGRQQSHQVILDKLEMIHQDMLQNQSKTMIAATGAAAQQRSPGVSEGLYKVLQEKQHEVMRLRQDMAILRQIVSESHTEAKEILVELHMKTKEYREQQRSMVVPEDGGGKNRRYMQETKKRSEATATTITHQLKDLQGIVDQLKLDVTQRRCRPSTTQLELCDNQVRTLEKEIDGFDQLIKAAKPIWKLTWESELQNVVNEQRFVKDQETLILDLRDDHADLLEVLQQLKKISEIQARNKVHSKKVIPGPEVLFRDHGDGSNSGMASVLKQVSTIEVDHSKRVEALEKAEKQRARELASRIDHFEKELSTFVDGKKLKRTGGPEQADRQRKKKDEEILKELYGASPNKE